MANCFFSNNLRMTKACKPQVGGIRICRAYMILIRYQCACFYSNLSSMLLVLCRQDDRSFTWSRSRLYSVSEIRQKNSCHKGFSAIIAVIWPMAAMTRTCVRRSGAGSSSANSSRESCRLAFISHYPFGIDHFFVVTIELNCQKIWH